MTPDPGSLRKPMATRAGAPRKPMAPVRQLSLFRREIRERVCPVGLELLLRSATRISEGKVSPAGRFYGSTMLTIDLERARPRVRDACDVATATRLARLMAADVEVLAGVREFALAEARRLAGRALGSLEVDLRVRSEGSRIFIDMDVEGSLSAVAGRGSP